MVTARPRSARLVGQQLHRLDRVESTVTIKTTIQHARRIFRPTRGLPAGLWRDLCDRWTRPNDVNSTTGCETRSSIVAGRSNLRAARLIAGLQIPPQASKSTLEVASKPGASSAMALPTRGAPEYGSLQPTLRLPDAPMRHKFDQRPQNPITVAPAQSACGPIRATLRPSCASRRRKHDHGPLAWGELDH